MRNLMNNTITSTRMNGRDTRRREDMIRVCTDFRNTNCTDIPNSPSDEQRNIVSIWTRLCSLISQHTATWRERQRYENSYTLGFNGQGPKTRPMKKRADYPQAVNTLLVLRRQVENPIRIFLNIRDADSDHLKNVKDWNSNRDVGDGTIGLNLLPLQTRGRHKNGKNGKNNLFSFALERITGFRQRPIEERQRMEEQWREWGWISWSEPSFFSNVLVAFLYWKASLVVMRRAAGTIISFFSLAKCVTYRK